MVEASRLRSAGLAVLAVGIVIGPAVVLAGGWPGSPAVGTGTGDGRLIDEGDRPQQPEIESLGASGVLPTMELRFGVVATMVAPGDPAVIPPNSINIPPVVLDVYRRAERILAQRVPDCGVPWSLLAGVGRVVSDHARGGGVDKRGTTIGPILGPSLDGSPGLSEIADTDDGRLDGDRTWDRAAGPMQIISVVWHRVGADGDRDGTADPHNVYDAALAAGRYLCENRAELRTPGGQVRAVFRYQRSEPFVRSTMLWTRVYEAAALPPPAAGEVPALPPVESVTLSGEPPPAPLPSGPASAPVPPRPDRPPPPAGPPAPPPGTTPPGTTPTTSPTTTSPTPSEPPSSSPPSSSPPSSSPPSSAPSGSSSEPGP